MRIKHKNQWALSVLLCLLSVQVHAQLNTEKEVDINFSIPPVALLDIEPDINNSIHFSISPATESGKSLQFENTSSTTLWLNYSSALPAGNASRSIVAQVAGGTLPEGLTLHIQAANYVGNGAGKLGKPAGKIALTGQARVLLSDVGNCYTGDGAGQGHALTFALELDDYSKISSIDESTFTIVYTISDR